jgi:predicted nucleotidyltransferase
MLQPIIITNIEVLRDICERYHVEKLYAFGSVCRDDFQDTSDIDLLVHFDKELALADYLDNFLMLKEELEGLFHRKVDLINEKYVKNPYVINGIEKTRTSLYAE